MRVEVFAQLIFGRLRDDGEVVAHERHLLRETPAHDDVVTIQAEAHRFARQHFFVDALFDQSLQLFGRRLALRLRFPERRELRHFACG